MTTLLKFWVSKVGAQVTANEADINGDNNHNNLIDDDDDDQDQNGHIDDKDNVRNNASMLRSFKAAIWIHDSFLEDCTLLELYNIFYLQVQYWLGPLRSQCSQYNYLPTIILYLARV